MRCERGFTVAEILVYMLISVLVIGAIYQVLIGQNRLYMKQRELQDVRGTIRAGANLLAFELRQTSASNNDIYAISDTSFMVRSLSAGGIVCAIGSNGFNFGLYNMVGEFEEPTFNAGGWPLDSVFLFAAGSSGTGDDQWLIRGVKAMNTSPAVVGLPYCFYGDTATIAAEWAIQLDTAGVGVPSGVTVGAPIRIWQQVRYGLFLNTEDNRWWLGRSTPLEQVDGKYLPVAGPLSQPSDSGLTLRYYDSAGATTLDPTKVRMVDIHLRGESIGKARSGSTGLPVFSEDSLTLKVSVRG